MLKQKIINQKDGHIIITSNEPIRIEIIKGADSGYLCYVYKGIDVDIEQEPDLIFDSLENNN
jgi:hypothetical protein